MSQSGVLKRRLFLLGVGHGVVNWLLSLEE